MTISKFVYVGKSTWLSDDNYMIKQNSRGLYELTNGDKLVAVQTSKKKAEAFAK